jgi:hypothetical protein
MVGRDEAIARLRTSLKGRRTIAEKAMFGGICFMLRDHMLCAASARGFMFRVGADQEAQALARPGATMMVMNGRRFHGYVRVDPQRCSDRDLTGWVALAERYVATLPPKERASRRTTGKPAKKRAAKKTAARPAPRAKRRIKTGKTR